jgi:ribonuclease HII
LSAVSGTLRVQVSTETYIVGIDEAGRGPIAGPVAVAAVAIPASLDNAFFSDIRDSKMLPQHKREAWYAALQRAHQNNELSYAVSFSSPRYIDTYGITASIAAAMDRTLRRVQVRPACTYVKLDGSLKAPKRFMQQETIVGGDKSESVIALASIAAKVTRDAYMRDAGATFPEYGFERHKGYGTKEHYAQLKQFGLSPIHRSSFSHPC